jgi:hypothetical protein
MALWRERQRESACILKGSAKEAERGRSKTARGMNELECDPAGQGEERLPLRIATTSERLPAGVAKEEDGDVDIGGEEARGGELTPQEHREPVENDNGGDKDDSEPGRVGLEGRLVRKIVSGHVLGSHTVVESEVRQQDDPPAARGTEERQGSEHTETPNEEDEGNIRQET